MCGIVGYTGKNNAVPILLDSLELLEHRGYDSVGVGCIEEDGDMNIKKCVGRVRELRQICEQNNFRSPCGIGHTRWATHGGVTKKNAHPHRYGKVMLVHNGIIENYRELIEDYELEGQLLSDTDTEVVAILLNHYYHGDPYVAIQKVVHKLKGTFALVMMFEDQPGMIYAIRNVSPIVAAQCAEGMMLASDLTALGNYAEEYYVVPEYAVLKMSANEMEVTDLDGTALCLETQILDWEVGGVGKEGYPFYMEKEIAEQPEVFRKMIQQRIVDGLPNFQCDGLPDEVLTACKKICIVACGTSMHVGLIAQALGRTILRMHIDVELASEFLCSNPLVDSDTLVIAISQSGETVDTLEAFKYAKQCGGKGISILNVRGSAIARESDYALYTEAGPELSVASTKAYTTQLAMVYLLVARMALIRGVMTKPEVEQYIAELQKVPKSMERILARKRDVHVIAKEVLDSNDLFMLGKSMDYLVLLEGSLKLKEVSYIHSEAYASGELKHGPIALITEHTPVIGLLTQEKIVAKALSNIREVKARGANVVLFVKEELTGYVKEKCKLVLLPDLDKYFMVFPAVVALQLLAYYVSLDKGLDVDKPRNLAKVVTVE